MRTHSIMAARIKAIAKKRRDARAEMLFCPHCGTQTRCENGPQNTQVQYCNACRWERTL